MPALELRLREASAVLGVHPRDLQNLVQFGVLRPRRAGRFHIFDWNCLLQAMAAFHLKGSLGASTPMLARFVAEIFSGKNLPAASAVRDVAILSRPAPGTDPVRVDVPLRALARQLDAQLAASTAGERRPLPRSRKAWQQEITAAFAEAAEDLRGITHANITAEIRRYRTERKQQPEVTAIASTNSFADARRGRAASAGARRRGVM